MQKLLTLFAFVFFAASTSFAQENLVEVNNTGSQIDFDVKTMDYGTITQGANGVREFKFTNTGNAPLIISAAKGSCGCTVPSFPKEPIMPGGSNVIKVKYDTKRVGPFTKYVTLTTNATDNTSVRLTIKGVVQAEADPIEKKEKSFMD